jgi:histidinol-phosphate aminotransferase
LDEAYFGFSDKQIDLPKLIEKYDNLIVVRTLSKLYGLAGLRIGYSISNKYLKKILCKKSPLFGISIISQLVAVTALNEKEYYDNLQKTMIKVKNDFTKELNKRSNFRCYLSDANFIIIKVTGHLTVDLTKYLKQNNYLIRECGTYGLSNYLRISIGKKEQMNDIIRLFDSYIKAEQ